MRRQYQYMDESSGVGVIDKSVAIFTALESGSLSLSGLCAATGLPRPTAHRLAVALEHHRLVSRDGEGRFVLGPRLGELAAAGSHDELLEAAAPVLARLRDTTGESTQLYRRQGDGRVCVAAAELPFGLRNTVPVGSRLPLTAGSAAQVLLAWESSDRLHRGAASAVFGVPTLARVRRQGWAMSVAEREPGVASVSAPVRSTTGRVIAAVSVSGPIERLTRNPGRLHAAAVVAAGNAISQALQQTAPAAG
jgi:DNA-binding IclR family transcriptional regulator